MNLFPIHILLITEFLNVDTALMDSSGLAITESKPSASMSLAGSFNAREGDHRISVPNAGDPIGMRNQQVRTALTLIEVLVAITIIGILTALFDSSRSIRSRGKPADSMRQ